MPHVRKYFLSPGQVFGRLTVIRELPTIVGKPRSVLCLCVCGTETTVLLGNLRRGGSQSCGCLRRETAAALSHSQRRFVVVPGQVFGRLTVVSSEGAHATCTCVCGRTTRSNIYSLLSGNTISCGCWGLEKRTAARRTLGGLTGIEPVEYGRWRNFMRRCYDPASVGFANYGGRGITVDSRWREVRTYVRDIKTFGLLVEPPICGLVESRYPPESYSIDRIDNNGPYSLANCRWASRQVQTRNRRNAAAVG